MALVTPAEQTRTTTTHVFDARGKLSEVRVPRVVLEVLRGPDVRRNFTLQHERNVIGTGAGCEVRLNDETVSACHCELSFTTEGCRVVDLGSKNGVLLASRRVADGFVEVGDVLQLGSTALRVTSFDGVTSRSVADRTSLGALLGGSVAMRLLYEQIVRVAASDAAVLISGETGTGKELVAETVVALGARASAPFVVVDCARQTSELFEAELFGVTRGAFTGATSDAPGAFMRANGGTVLLDQVCELPMALQPLLLGVLERRQVQPIGGTPVGVDVRVIATSRRPLERELNRGAFRSDLFFRLAQVQLHVPSLRERRDDVPTLVAHFCKQLGLVKPVPAFLLEQLYAGDYPGNVRELQNAVARAALGLMPEPVSSVPAPELDLDEPYWPQRERFDAQLERRYLARLLDACDNNVSEAARRSGISRVQLYAMFARHGLSVQRRR